jgi:heat shock protein HslJ
MNASVRRAATCTIATAALLTSTFFLTVTSAAARTTIQTTSERIEFAAGKTSAVRKGSVRGYATRDYELQATEGQLLSVKLASKSTFLYFNVLDKESMTALEAEPSPREVTEWAGRLPKTATYVVRVYLVRAEARRNKAAVGFTLTVSITGDSAGMGKPVFYQCDGNGEVVVTFNNGDPATARVEAGDRTWTLTQAPSGSGARFTDGAVTFWTHGSEATFESPDLSLSCLAMNREQTSAVELETGEWRLVKLIVDGKRTDVPTGASVTATFKNGRATGNGGCNRYFSSYAISNTNNLAMGAIGSTRMMCPDHADLESFYFTGLSKVTRFAINGDLLHLTTASGALLFTRTVHVK